VLEQQHIQAMIAVAAFLLLLLLLASLSSDVRFCLRQIFG